MTIYQGDVVYLKMLPNKKYRHYDESYDGWYILLRDQKSKEQMYFNLDNANMMIPPAIVSRDKDSAWMADKIFLVTIRLFGDDAIKYMHFSCSDEDIRQERMRKAIVPLQNQLERYEKNRQQIDAEIEKIENQITDIMNGQAEEVLMYHYIVGKHSAYSKELTWIIPSNIDYERICPGMTAKVETCNGVENVIIVRVYDSDEYQAHRKVISVF